MKKFFSRLIALVRALRRPTHLSPDDMDLARWIALEYLLCAT